MFINQLTITIMHKMLAFICVFFKKEIIFFPANVPNKKNEDDDRKVCKEPLAKKLTSQCTVKHPCSNRDNKLEALHLHST